MNIDLLSPEYKKGLLLDFGTFHKIIRISDHLIEEIGIGLPPLRKGENHIIRAAEYLYETEAIDFDILSLIYDGKEDIPGSIFRLLENYLLGDYVLEEVSDSVFGLYTRQKVFNNYAELGRLLQKSIDQRLKYPTKQLAITDQTSKKVIEKLSISVNPELWHAIIRAFEFDISEIYNRDSLLILLKNADLISDRQEGYFRTISHHVDFVRYLRYILNGNENFLKGLTEEQLKELDNRFYALDLFDGETTEKQFLENNNARISIVAMGADIIQSCKSGNSGSLNESILNTTLEFMKEYFPYKPFYLRIINAEFYKIIESSSHFDKVIQILGILVCDILPYKHPLFEDASELLLRNTRSKKNYAAISSIIYSKQNDIEVNIPRKTGNFQRIDNTAMTDLEGQLEYQDSDLVIWMRDILDILESGSLYDEGPFVSQFYAFLLQNGFLSQDDFLLLQEAGDDNQNLFGIIEQIFVRNFLGGSPGKESKFLETFLAILNNKGDHQRYKRLVGKNKK